MLLRDFIGWRTGNFVADWLQTDSMTGQPLQVIKNKVSLHLGLTEWAVKCNVTQTGVTSFLHILKTLHPELCRILLEKYH